jgi:TonB family protein
LVGAAVFSALIPLIKPEWISKSEISNQLQYSWTNANMMVMQGFASPVHEEVKWVLGDYLTLIYITITLALIVNLVFKLVKVKQLLKLKNHPEAFSFFNKIWVNKQLPHHDEITKHELTHAKHLHSADVLFFEVICIINWFNPICYFYRKSVKHIHEFIADEQAIKNSNQVHDYAMLLFNKSFGVNPNQLTNNFFNQSMLKRRIQMLQKEKSKKIAILKYGLSVPLFLLAMILSSATISKNETIKSFAKAIEPNLAVIDIILPEKVVELVIPAKEVKSKIEIIENEKFADELNGLKKHFTRNLRYPAEARDNQIMGKVAVEFQINNSGMIENPKALTLKNSVLAKEAVRVFENFEDKIIIASGTYTFVFDFQLDGLKNTAEDEVKSLGIIKNFAGEILVLGYPPKHLMLNQIEVVGYLSKGDSLKNPNNKVKGVNLGMDTETAIYEVKVAKDGDDDKVYQKVEVLPNFEGGLDGFRDFLMKNLKYPARAKSAGVSGRVYCQFVVEKDGSLTNINVVRGIGSGCDEEAIRVLAISPNWKPAQNEGKPVRVVYTIPIFFELPARIDKGEVSTATKNADVEVLPTYPGGLVEFGKFLKKNIKYPIEAKKNKTEGRVYLNFIVEADGSLSEPKVLRGIGGGCDEEAIRVMKLSPNWIPGTNNGKKVRVAYTIPIIFELEGNVSGVNLNKTNTNDANKDLINLVGSNNPNANPPLIYLDGKLIKYENLKNIKPDDIQSVNVLKDEAAIKAYGEKGKNGAVIITSKKKN